jgi:hypothetical protein
VEWQRYLWKEDHVWERKDRNKPGSSMEGRCAGPTLTAQVGCQISFKAGQVRRGALAGSAARLVATAMPGRLPIIVGVGQVSDKGEEVRPRGTGARRVRGDSP